MSAGSVCRHLKIVGRVPIFTILSRCQQGPWKLQHNLCGHTRLLAAKKLGLKQVPVSGGPGHRLNIGHKRLQHSHTALFRSAPPLTCYTQGEFELECLAPHD